jgi:curved DNA-binding protein CbpA
MPDIDPYKVLQVDPEAEDEVIQAAYRRLAQKYHPDLSPGPDAAERMVAINAARGLIGTPELRAAYDRERRLRDARAAATPAEPARTAASPPGQRAPARDRRPATDRPPEHVSSDWTAGRSGIGGGYDPSMRAPEGLGAAGPPPGNPSGSVLNFGRYAGWSLGEVARADVDYIEWLDRMPIGRMYRDEIDAILRRSGRRRSAAAESQERRGLFRRR